MKRIIRKKIIVVMGIAGLAFGISELSFSNNNINKSIECNNITKKSNIMLVNKVNSLQKEYVPEGLVEVQIPFYNDVTYEERFMVKEAADALVQMFNEASKDGIELYGVSGYRSYETQDKLYKESLRNNGRQYTNIYVAKSGKSEHQLGLAMDIGGVTDFISEGTREAIWLEENCYKYGFVIRYVKGKEDITGYGYEPWHVRYVGEALAEEAYKSNSVLEELL